MPSSRGLAQHLGISRITVTLAYSELVSADYLEARGRSGYFVSESAPRAPEVPLRAPRVESGEFQRLIAGRFQGLAQIDRPADWESYPHNFIYGQADPSLFDHQNWRLSGSHDQLPMLAMRCAAHACETAVAAMEVFTRENVPKGGISEDDIWSVLHAENIRRGGEWIETRLLASGPRTNPWFQECGPRLIQNNEIVAFDTDLIGCYGICIDISRTWWVGDARPQPLPRRSASSYIRVSGMTGQDKER